MKHYSATHQIAQSLGLSVRTVQRLIRDAHPDRERTWLKPGIIDPEAVAAALHRGRARCSAHPRRHALKSDPE